MIQGFEFLAECRERVDHLARIQIHPENGRPKCIARWRQTAEIQEIPIDLHSSAEPVVIVVKKFSVTRTIPEAVNPVFSCQIDIILINTDNLIVFIVVVKAFVCAGIFFAGFGLSGHDFANTGIDRIGVLCLIPAGDGKSHDRDGDTDHSGAHKSPFLYPLIKHVVDPPF